MGRYANRTITFEFPDLSEDDDLIWVKIRNPKTVPADTLMPEDLEDGPDGKPDTAATIQASYSVMANLIVDWHVYDGTSDEDSDPLPIPATPEHLRSIPFEITQKIAESIGEVLTTPR